MKKILLALIGLSIVSNVGYTGVSAKTINNDLIAVATSKNIVNSKYENAKKSTIPYSMTIKELADNINNEIAKLTEKQNVGLDVAEDLLILNYKYSKLSSLDTQNDAFDKMYNGFEKGIITQDEYNKLRSEIQMKDYVLKDEYDKIMNATATDIKKEIQKLKKQTKNTTTKSKGSQIGRTLLNEGTYYMNPSSGYMIRRGMGLIDLLRN